MAYIGSAPTANTSQFSSIYTQSFSGTGAATSFTLGRAVASVNNIEVVVNNVQQSPFDGSYTVTGLTTLLFSEAPSSGTNNIYVIYRDQPVQSITDTGAVRKTGDTLTGALTLGGLLDTGSTGQIKFPASQNPSSDANTLDDYEEGTWTPAINRVTTSPTGQTYGRQIGSYVKIGRWVYLNCEIQLSGAPTAAGSGYNYISGIPFPISFSNAIWGDMGGSVKYNTAFSTTTVTALSGGTGAGAVGIGFLASTRSTSEINEPWTSGYITFTAVYQTTA